MILKKIVTQIFFRFFLNSTKHPLILYKNISTQKNLLHNFFFIFTQENDDWQHGVLLMEQRRLKQKVSHRFVFDPTEPIQSIHIPQLLLLSIILKRSCWLFDQKIVSETYGELILQIHLEHGDHLLISAKKQEFDIEDLDKIFTKYAENFTKDDLMNLKNFLFARYVKNKEFVTKKIDESENETAAALSLLHMFSTILDHRGVCLITRVLKTFQGKELDKHELIKQGCIDPLTKEILEMKEFEDVGGFDVDAIKTFIMIDALYFLPMKIVKEMKYPSEINHFYIKISDELNIRNDPTFTTTLEGKVLEDYEKDGYSYYKKIKKIKDKQYEIKLCYDDNVFFGVKSTMIEVIFGSHFEEWTKKKEVDFTLWVGKDEKQKLLDVEKLKEDIKKKEMEIVDLKIERERILNKQESQE